MQESTLYPSSLKSRNLAPDTIPTIRISARLMQQADTLLYDSLKLVSDTLRSKDLLYDKTWELDLTNIDQSKLKDAVKQLYVTIQFNGAQQYSAVLPVTIQSTATGVDRVAATGEDEEDATYTLGGVRLDPKGKLPAGVYIRNGKKVVVKP